MIPHYPVFKKLDLSDKAEIDAHNSQLPLYCDFEFANLWSWDVKGGMEISQLNRNLVIKFTDYNTGMPLLTFTGVNDVNRTASKLIAGRSDNEDKTLQLIPEITAQGLDPNTFRVDELPDHADYICTIERHLDYSAPCMKSHRRLYRQFTQRFADSNYVALDLQCERTREEIDALRHRWNKNKGLPATNEPVAIARFIEASSVIPHTAIGIRTDGQLIALHIASLPAGTCANAIFSKADTAYRGVYAALDHVVACDLIPRGYTHVNIQQDLGFPTLRSAKLALHPSGILKKYSVQLKS